MESFANFDALLMAIDRRSTGLALINKGNFTEHYWKAKYKHLRDSIDNILATVPYNEQLADAIRQELRRMVRFDPDDHDSFFNEADRETPLYKMGWREALEQQKKEEQQ